MKSSKLNTRGFAATRTRLGFSQRQLAQQLGISKAAVGMAETGRRNLPVTALLKLAELEIKTAAALVAAATNTKENRTWLSTDGRCDMEIRELQCEMHIQKLTRLLQTSTLQYERFQQQLQLLNDLLDNERASRQYVQSLPSITTGTGIEAINEMQPDGTNLASE